MTLILNNDDVKSVPTIEITMKVLEDAWHQIGRREAVCRPRVDVQIRTKNAQKMYQRGTSQIKKMGSR